MGRRSMTLWLVLVSVAAIGAYVFVRSRRTTNGDATRAYPAKHVDPALFDAAANGDAEKVTTLVRNGADPSLRNDEWTSPLGIACARANRQVVRALLDAGADPNGPAMKDQPALFVAVSYLRSDIVPDLIAAGAALDHSDPIVGSALNVAIAKQDPETATLLVQAGIPLELRNPEGARALHVAALAGNEELTRLLLAKGADLHCPNFQGGTPLRSAAAKGDIAIVRMLLAAGADPSPVDDFDKRAIDYAKEGGHDDVVSVLEKAKTRPSAARNCPTDAPLASVLPPREDATLKIFRQARQQGTTPVKAAASSLEAPSMIAALSSVVGAPFKVAFPVDGQPDLRSPIRPVDVVLWSYGPPGNLTHDARPAVPRPREAVMEQVIRVAERPYQLSSWSRVAAKAARELRAEPLQQVLGAMVHPPEAPEYIEPWDWYLRVQVAAALIVSYLGDEPWAESRRRKALEDVLDGPADWTNTAAVIALLDVGRRDERARPSVLNALLHCARRAVAPAAYQHAIRPAALAVLELPGVGQDVVKEMKGITKDNRNR
jgi:ankyrin repeat protein